MSAVSISKGVFVYKNGLERAIKQKRRISKCKQRDNRNIFADEIWYKSFNTLWNNIEVKIDNLNKEMFSHILSNLVSFISSSYQKAVMEIPAAILLTGINMPDHGAQFSALAKEIRREVSPHVATIHAEDCQTLKQLVENLINQLINIPNASSDCEEEDDDDDDAMRGKNKIKKSQCSFALLQSWYEENKRKEGEKVVAVIIPDFESFNKSVLQNFIQIASSYMNVIPFVLVFGVATSLSALHKSLPFPVSSKVNIQVFHSQQSTVYLNNVLENVFFTNDCPFHLDGKLFTLFTDVFLFYDFSVSGFIQNFKYAMLEHFSSGNIKALCTYEDNIKHILDDFKHDDYENVRRLLSFRSLVEAETMQNRIKLLEDDEHLRIVLQEELTSLHEYMRKFHVLLKCLQILVSDLPKAPLGKQVRELYITATSSPVTATQEFKEAFQLLAFQSKDELTIKLRNAIAAFIAEIDSCVENEEFCKEIIFDLESLMNELAIDIDGNDSSQDEIDDNRLKEKIDRKQLKEMLLEMSKKSKPMNKYEKSRRKVLDYFEFLFDQYLVPPSTFPFYEIFFFNDLSIQNNIIGSHRAAIHTALNDPSNYLQCDCCKLPNAAAILNTMPDICVAYKLHLEYGKMINLYDWLQAFISIVEPISDENEDETEKKIDPHLQARFTQCVAELEYLGFVKSSKRKTDHVARLTWGG